jgi:hypothetical protein
VETFLYYCFAIAFAVQVFWPLPSQGYCRLLADGSDDRKKDLRTTFGMGSYIWRSYLPTSVLIQAAIHETINF